MDAVLQTMVDEKIGPGERRRDFLKLFAQHLNLKDGITDRSYPSALATALKAVGVKEGDKVIVSVLSPRYTGRSSNRLAPRCCLPTSLPSAAV